MKNVIYYNEHDIDRFIAECHARRSERENVEKGKMMNKIRAIVIILLGAVNAYLSLTLAEVRTQLNASLERNVKYAELIATQQKACSAAGANFNDMVVQEAWGCVAAVKGKKP